MCGGPGAAESISIDPMGLTAGKANQIKEIAGPDCDVKSCSLSEIKTYVNDDGAWKALSYHESPAMGAE